MAVSKANGSARGPAASPRGRAALAALFAAALAACSDKPPASGPAKPASDAPSAAAPSSGAPSTSAPPSSRAPSTSAPPSSGAPSTSAAPPTRTLVPFHYLNATLVGYRDAASGLVVLPPRYQQARPFSAAGVAFVWENEWQLIDTMGQILFKPLEVDNGPDDFAEGVARFRRGGKVGFFDERGREVIGARHDWVERFHESRAAFCDGCRGVPDGEHKRIAGGRWGYLDHSGREAITSRFDAAGDFQGGVANVLLAGRRFFIRPDGSEARPDAGR